MIKLRFALMILAPAAQAQVLECPKFYPWQDTVLTEVPYNHTGKGLVPKGRLAGAGLTIGEFNGGGDIQGDRKQVKGGWEVDFGVLRGRKWFVCHYEPGNTSWWEQLDDKETACKLKIVTKNSEGMMDATLRCK